MKRKGYREHRNRVGNEIHVTHFKKCLTAADRWSSVAIETIKCISERCSQKVNVGVRMRAEGRFYLLLFQGRYLEYPREPEQNNKSVTRESTKLAVVTAITSV